jgi:3'-phosphoadenosine 5'-phosphosulfate sulfotransferase (PAPS reductase)/FAD synthetase
VNAVVVTPPPEASGLWIVASVSGGKDSTALLLALLEAVERGELPMQRLRFAFADTGWEAPETYAYLDYLRATLKIAIDVVRAVLKQNDQGDATGDGGMINRIQASGRFPGRRQRWCTQELKIEPLRAFHDRLIEETGIETVSAMGIRADESDSRALMPEWDDEPADDRSWGGYVWRPLLRWSISDVLEMHNRHGVKVNPLYQRGHNRVGCYPCIFSSKEEISLIAEHAPWRIDEIRELEAQSVTTRQARNEERPGRYKHVDDASFFQTQRKGFSGIDEVVTWALGPNGARWSPTAPPCSYAARRVHAVGYLRHAARTREVMAELIAYLARTGAMPLQPLGAPSSLFGAP